MQVQTPSGYTLSSSLSLTPYSQATFTLLPVTNLTNWFQIALCVNGEEPIAPMLLTATDTTITLQPANPDPSAFNSTMFYLRPTSGPTGMFSFRDVNNKYVSVNATTNSLSRVSSLGIAGYFLLLPLDPVNTSTSNISFPTRLLPSPTSLLVPSNATYIVDVINAVTLNLQTRMIPNVVTSCVNGPCLSFNQSSFQVLIT